MSDRISVIIPTLNRPTLEATLASCKDATQVVLMPDPRGEEGAYGHGLRNRCLDEGLATGDWLVSIDDDDEFLPGAFEAMRAAVAEHPGRWFIFKMTFGDGSHYPGVTVWDRPQVRVGNVGTPMILAPASAKSRWGVEGMTGLIGEPREDGFLGDFVYAQRLREELGEPTSGRTQ